MSDSNQPEERCERHRPDPLERYHFTDDHGHPLRNCVEYQMLLDKADRWEHLEREGEAVGEDALYRRMPASDGAEIERLRGNLLKYGGHIDECAEMDLEPCTCGWVDQAISAGAFQDPDRD